MALSLFACKSNSSIDNGSAESKVHYERVSNPMQIHEDRIFGEYDGDNVFIKMLRETLTRLIVMH